MNSAVRVLAAVLAVWLASCATEPAGGPPPAPAAAVATSVVTPTDAPAVTLDVVLARLAPAAAADPRVSTAEDDPNHLLGRPGGYTARATFALPGGRPEAGDDVARGGSVEIWPAAELARRRADQLRAAFSSAPIVITEYHYLAGPVLVRVTGDVTPTNAAKVEAAVGALPR